MKPFRLAILLLAGAAAPARGASDCATFRFDTWADFTGSNVALSGGASLLKSREIGDLWEDVSLPGSPNTGIYDLVQGGDGSLYAAAENPYTGQVIWRSTDGVSWTPSTLYVNGLRRAQKASRLARSRDGGCLYAATADTTVFWPEPGLAGVWRTSNGVDWEVMTGLPGEGCTSVAETADGKVVATTKGDGRVWLCADPEAFPDRWTAVWETAAAEVGGALPQPNYPPYPPPYLPACEYLSVNYHGEHCNGQPYDDYPVPFRPSRTMGLFRASDGWLYFATDSGEPSKYSSLKSVRGFGHIYASSDGLSWRDGGAFLPPQTDSPEYYFTVGTWSELSHNWAAPDDHPADNPPTDLTYPTWIDNFHEDSEGNVYACSSNSDPTRSWILNPRRDGVAYRLEKGARPEENVWNALGNLYAQPKSPCATDSYTSYNATFCHDLTSDPATGDLWAATSMLGMVHRSEDGGASFDWWTSPRQVVHGRDATGDFTSLLLTCGSCLYAGYVANGEIYASRARYPDEGWIGNTAGWPYAEPLSAFREETGADSFGSITYQISPDGSAFYWWDGAAWTAADDSAQSNPAGEIASRLESFFAPGTFYFRAFLRPETVAGCPKTPRLASLTVCSGAAAALSLVKTVCATADDGVCLAQPGGPVSMRYEVANAGSVELEEIVVTDDGGTPGETGDDFIVGTVPGPVPPGADFSFLTTALLGASLWNTAWANSTGDGVPVSASDDGLALTWLVAAANDYNGDGAADMALWSCPSSLWRIRLSPAGTPAEFVFGQYGDLPVPGDYDGDGTADPAVYRPYRGLWAVRDLTRFFLGEFFDHPVPADYDGDGSSEAGVFRQSEGLWSVRFLTRAYFGDDRDVPVPGDYAGDGTGRIALFRPAEGVWNVRGLSRKYFGTMGDIPAGEDFDGDGRRDYGVFRPGTGLWRVATAAWGATAFFGEAGDWPQPADYSGDGTADLAVYRPADGLWAVRFFTRSSWGGAEEIPVTRR